MASVKINVVLADDHPVLLRGIIHELSGVTTLNIAGTANNSTTLIDLLGNAPTDVLVTDYSMPGGEYGDGMQLISFLRRRFPDLKIIVFTAIANAALAAEMLKLGVRAVLSKLDDVSHLISAIHAVQTGARYVSPSLDAMQQANAGPVSAGTHPELTKREAEVIRLYVSGMSIDEIAAQLHRTKQTVSAQKKSAMRKLGIERDAQLFLYVYETGLVSQSQSGTHVPPAGNS
ncbi:response regulator transcription factor [Burkholderia diffusa]|uniref:response regulator transcription factor n=1 Tax=Burkholderia diffusa TaxID=488732 RepID=UPI00075EBD7B|nr:response regulator transcription factor [Burkholderia diffusa]KVH48400.1 LuxR family transcriptional regulator [Burkholderia diffusa]